MRSKRVALSLEDAEVIRVALDLLHRSSIINPLVYPEYGLASKQRMDQIKAKLPRSSFVKAPAALSPQPKPKIAEGKDE